MDTDYDVIVAGLGAMGSAALCHLANAGMRVLGLDRFHPPHSLGSSHGRTRIIREAYFENPLYVPLVQRAYELWGDLERQTGRQLFLKTGGLMIGRPDSALVAGARRSAEQHHLPHELLSSTELKDRFPALNPEPEMVAVWEPRAGVLFPELAIQAHLEMAAKQGAHLRFEEPLLNWQPQVSGLTVLTGNGRFTTKKLVLTAGAWLNELLPDLRLPLSIERQVLFWFEPDSNPEDFKQCPIHLWQYGPHSFFYGFPDLGDGVKVALHHQGETVDPATVRREVNPEEEAGIRKLLRRFLPSAEGRLNSAAVCLYTNTPDEHFILDYHPIHHAVVIASPCSGHGFKFSCAIGEIIAAMIEEVQPRFDLSLFNISRFCNS